MQFSFFPFFLLPSLELYEADDFHPYLFEKDFKKKSGQKMSSDAQEAVKVKNKRDQEKMKIRYCDQYWGLPGQG